MVIIMGNSLKYLTYLETFDVRGDGSIFVHKSTRQFRHKDDALIDGKGRTIYEGEFKVENKTVLPHGKGAMYVYEPGYYSSRHKIIRTVFENGRPVGPFTFEKQGVVISGKFDGSYKFGSHEIRWPNGVQFVGTTFKQDIMLDSKRICTDTRREGMLHIGNRLAIRGTSTTDFNYESATLLTREDMSKDEWQELHSGPCSIHPINLGSGIFINVGSSYLTMGNGPSSWGDGDLLVYCGERSFIFKRQGLDTELLFEGSGEFVSVAPDRFKLASQNGKKYERGIVYEGRFDGLELVSGKVTMPSVGVGEGDFQRGRLFDGTVTMATGEVTVVCMGLARSSGSEHRDARSSGSEAPPAYDPPPTYESERRSAHHRGSGEFVL